MLSPRSGVVQSRDVLVLRGEISTRKLGRMAERCGRRLAVLGVPQTVAATRGIHRSSRRLVRRHEASLYEIDGCLGRGGGGGGGHQSTMEWVWICLRWGLHADAPAPAGEKIGPTPRWGSKGGIPSDLVHLVDDPGEEGCGPEGGGLGGGVLLGSMASWTHTTPPMPTTCTPRASTLPLTPVPRPPPHHLHISGQSTARWDPVPANPSAHLSLCPPPLHTPLPKVPPMRLAHSRCRRSETR